MNDRPQLRPRITDAWDPLRGTFAPSEATFEVDEIPAYAPSGEGDHTLVRIEKRDMTTKFAVERLCQALGANAREAGIAGMKDRHAVTRQWVSLFRVAPDDALRAEVDGLRVLEAHSHRHKLKTGHLRGNRFTVRVQGADPSEADRLSQMLDALQTIGMPNYYGDQRFGRDGDNATQALAWLTGSARGPKEPFKRRLLVSSLQSTLFNDVLSARVVARTVNRALTGDVLRKTETGGIFVSEDATIDQPRIDSWEVSPTGPMFGASMTPARGEPGALEQATLDHHGLTISLFDAVSRIAEGTRRPLRVRPTDLTATWSKQGFDLQFALPSGSYATVLVEQLLDQGAKSGALG